MEWTDSNVALTADATRDARIGFFVPIENDQFNIHEGHVRLNAQNFYQGGGENADRIMVSNPKTNGAVWDQDPYDS